MVSLHECQTDPILVAALHCLWFYHGNSTARGLKLVKNSFVLPLDSRKKDTLAVIQISWLGLPFPMVSEPISDEKTTTFSKKHHLSFSVPSLKLTLHLKMDGWNTSFLSFWDGLFSGAMLVSGSVVPIHSSSSIVDRMQDSTECRSDEWLLVSQLRPQVVALKHWVDIRLQAKKKSSVG